MRKEPSHLKWAFDPVRSELTKFDRLLESSLSADSALIQSVIDHLLEKRGKRIRPTLLFLTARCCRMTHSKIVEAALSIELIHTATLLHDDVVDQSDQRRGHTTVNAKWNNLISILIGDYLFAKAFRLLVSTKCPSLTAKVSLATERVAFGELRQIEESGNYELTEDSYLEIIAAKTASLFSTSAASGAMLNGATAKDINRLSRFGEQIGISFQIADDLLDIVGDSNTTGKTVGSDLMQGKATLPLIFALRTSSKQARKEITDVLSNGTKPSEYKRIIEFIGNSGGIDYARQRAAEFGEKGLGLIRKFGESRYYSALEQVVNFTVNRQN
jgi:octaprenyl-diphosphate synthase